MSHFVSGRLKFELTDPNARPPKLSTLYGLVKQSVKNVWEKLQRQVQGQGREQSESDEEAEEPEHEYQVHTTIVNENLENGLNTGQFSLKTRSETIADRVVDMMFSYLQSNASSQLTNNFGIFFKIYSIPHTRHRERRGFESHSVGCSHLEKSKYFWKRWRQYLYKFDLPKLPIFLNQCLILCVVIGYYRSVDPEKYWFFLLASKRARAAKILFLRRELERLGEINPIFQKGPICYEEGLPALAKIYKCQIILYEMAN